MKFGLNLSSFLRRWLGFLCPSFLLVSFSYIEKFTDFLRLFVSVHLRRIESYSQFPVVEFLTLLFKYTFHQVNCQNCCSSFLKEGSFLLFPEEEALFYLTDILCSTSFMKCNAFDLLHDPVRLHDARCCYMHFTY